VADEKLGFGQRDASHRIERYCDACGQIDNHPHHIAGHPDGSFTDRHLDCCSTAGCPDGSCTEILAEAGDKRGNALIKHLTSGGAEHANYTTKEKS